MKKLNQRRTDPIFLESHEPSRQITLRIGESRPGETRIALLDPNEARILAYALLSAVEDLEVSKKP